jgi:hypothetical protein
MKLSRSNKIIFKSYRFWLNKESLSIPEPTQNTIPDWYKNADRFAKNIYTNEYYDAIPSICPVPKEGTIDDYGKIPTWKACPAIMDSFLTGYTLKTPCDLIFFKDENELINVKIKDVKHKDFCTKRPPMPQFEHPKGYQKDHFAWSPDWGLEVPEGYSCLYMTPMNRFDLPFLNTTGIVDNDKVHISGSFPFFLIENWEGTIPAGTPYMQILPFKRENWEHKIEFQNEKTIYGKMLENMKFYRKPDGGVYKNKVWSKREYK